MNKEDLKFLSERIAGAESRTAGEIRVAVRHRRHWKERSLSVHDLALREFYRLGMDKTERRSGVLILVLLSERKFQIIADEGIHSRVDAGTWDAIASEMTGHFRKGNIRDGIAAAIDRVGEALTRHLPRSPHQTDQLSNEVIEE